MNNTFKYDAFISYRQIRPDIDVAVKIHKLLEKYKLPKSLVKKGYPKKLKKIFRDIDELSATSDLPKTIKDALLNSKFLIVICSKNTMQSKWVKDEITFFKQYRDENKILYVLIEDNEMLLNNCVTNKIPLAINLTKDKRLVLNKLKQEKLRLIAPIIGCEYDDLVKRQEKQNRKLLIIFTIFASSIAFVFIVMSVSLIYTNKQLQITNKRLSNEILNTTAIYTQFLLPIQDDYKKWSKATLKLIEILKSKDINRAIKANDILAKYIALKGYKIKNRKNVLPFLEEPKHFLKTLFFRNTKFTTGYLEDRYISLLLLDNLKFPSELFIFLSNPSIKFPKIYQRLTNANKLNLKRYGYFLESLYYEKNNEHQKALKSLKKAGEYGFFCADTGNLSIFSLDNNYYFLHILNNENIKDLLNKNNRFMTLNEKKNLILNINNYYILAVELSQ